MWGMNKGTRQPTTGVRLASQGTLSMGREKSNGSARSDVQNSDGRCRF